VPAVGHRQPRGVNEHTKVPGNRIPSEQIPQRMCLRRIPELQPIEGLASSRRGLGPEPPSQQTNPASAGLLFLMAGAAFASGAAQWPAQCPASSQRIRDGRRASGLRVGPTNHRGVTSPRRRSKFRSRAAASWLSAVLNSASSAASRSSHAAALRRRGAPLGSGKSRRAFRSGIALLHRAGIFGRKLRAKPCSAAHAA
jgi:hypothetical protein